MFTVGGSLPFEHERPQRAGSISARGAEPRRQEKIDFLQRLFGAHGQRLSPQVSGR